MEGFLSELGKIFDERRQVKRVALEREHAVKAAEDLEHMRVKIQDKISCATKKGESFIQHEFDDVEYGACKKLEEELVTQFLYVRRDYRSEYSEFEFMSSFSSRCTIALRWKRKPLTPDWMEQSFRALLGQEQQHKSNNNE